MFKKYLISYILDSFKRLYRRDPLHGRGSLVELISYEAAVSLRIAILEVALMVGA